MHQVVLIKHCCHFCLDFILVTCIYHRGIDRFWTGILQIWNLLMLHPSPIFLWSIGTRMMTLSLLEAIW